jgi:hypothetical protein
MLKPIVWILVIMEDKAAFRLTTYIDIADTQTLIERSKNVLCYGIQYIRRHYKKITIYQRYFSLFQRSSRFVSFKNKYMPNIHTPIILLLPTV